MATGMRGLEIGVERSYPTGWTRLVVVGGVLVVAATVANVVLAMLLRTALEVPAGFTPLTAPAVISMTVAGMIGATALFGWLARERTDPRSAFVRIAAAALVLSWLPDLGIWATGVFAHTTGAGILALMVLHPVAAAFAIGILYRFGLPTR